MGKKDATLAKIIESELARTSEYWNGELATEQARALDYFAGRDRQEDTEELGSGYVSEDVAASVQATLAQMVGSISSDTIVEFLANSAQDEDQAQLETSLVNDLVIQSEEGQTEIIQAIHDALLLRTGVLKVTMESTEDVTVTRFEEGLATGDLGALLQADDQENERVDVEREGDEDGDEDGPVTIRKTRTRRRLRFKAVAPSRMRINLDAESVTLDECTFFAEEMYLTRSELVRSGLAKRTVYALKCATRGTDERSRKIQSVAPDAMEPVDESMETVRVWDVGVRYDEDGDGIAELHRVLYAEDDKKVLSNAVWPFVWYAVGTTEIVPHSIIGRSVFDRLRQVQDTNTATVRQWKLNMEYANSAEIAVVDGMVSADDVLTRGPGKAIRITKQGDLVPIPVPDLAGNALQMLGYMDKVRSEMGGASLDLQAAGAQIAGDTAMGIERQYASRELVAELQLRTLSLTLIRAAFKIAHATLREWSPGKMNAKFRGAWIESDPATWEPREKVRVSMVMSMSERQRQVQAFDRIIGQQVQAMGAGAAGVMVDFPQIHAAAIAQARLARIDTPERFWIDPMSPEAKQAAQAAAQAADQAKKDQAALGSLMLQIQQNLKLWETNVEYRFKYFESLLGAEVDMAKMAGASTERLEALEISGLLQSQQLQQQTKEKADGMGAGDGAGPRGP